MIGWIKFGIAIAIVLAIYGAYKGIEHRGYMQAETKYLPQLTQCTANVKTEKEANESLREENSKLDAKYAQSQKDLEAAGKATAAAVRARADALLALKRSEAAKADYKARWEAILNSPPAATKEQACEIADRVSLDYARSMRDHP